MVDALSLITTRATPQTEQADPRQAQNNAGGYSFVLDDESRLDRFLVTGVDSGTYYVNAKDLAVDNAQVVMRLAKSDGEYLVRRVVEISTAGRAPKQNAGVFALAMASVLGNDATRSAAYRAIPDVCRTGTTLFMLAKYRKQFGGSSRGWRNAVGRWYLGKNADDLAYQVIKYRQREGWTHRDLLRKVRPNPTDTHDARLRTVLRWAAGHEVDVSGVPFLEGYVKANEPGANVAKAVADYGLPWEALPDEALGRTDVWNALLDRHMPLGALVRQLPRLTRLGLLPQMGGRTADVVAQITDGDRLRKSRIHPMRILLAHKTYEQGHSEQGSSTWTPTRQVIDALDSAFYAAYGNVKPTGKRTLLALDVSGSMGMFSVGPITCREASAAIALVTANVEPNCAIVGYSNTLVELDISPRQRLSDAVRKISSLPFQSTDCRLPFRVAKQEKWALDTVVSMTDNETWAGPQHMHQALADYRADSGIPARSIVLGMTATGFTVNDPADPLGMDIGGFDGSVPQLISDFSAGV